jgi:hypothetical protein
MYFLVLAPFAWLAKRAHRREPSGWIAIGSEDQGSPRSQY